jgi:subtilisin family serine protease
MRVKLAALFLTIVMVVAGQTTAAPLSYVLETRPGVNATLLASRYSFTIQKSWTSSTETHYAITFLAPVTSATLKALSGESGVIEVESDAPVRAGGSESSTAGALEPITTQISASAPVSFYGATVRSSYVDQPAARIIRVKDAWQKYPTGSGVTVALIDTGVDEKHPALKNVLVPGYDFTRDLAGTASELADLDQSTVAILDQSTVAILDGKRYGLRLTQSTVAILDQSTVAILDGSKLPAAFGHGTMVAGLVHLVAPSARILPLKAFRADGSSSLSNIIRAVYYAVDHGANVVSMSFNLTAPSAELANAIGYGVSKGVIFVAAAGNDGKEKKLYPAAVPKVLGVGSTNYSDKRSSFSNYGTVIRAAAPGEALVTTYPGNNYAAVWGTSFSTPLVAGAVGIMRQIDSKLNYGKVLDSLEKGVAVGGDIGSRLSLPPVLQNCWSSQY